MPYTLDTGAEITNNQTSLNHTTYYSLVLGWAWLETMCLWPTLLESLGDMLLLRMAHSWQMEWFDLVHQYLNDSSLVCRCMVGLKIQILIHVGGLAVHRGADGAGLLPHQENLQAGEFPIWLLLHRKLDVVVAVVVDVVEVATKGVYKVAREYSTSVVSVLSPETWSMESWFRLLLNVLHHQVSKHYQYWWSHGCAMHLLVAKSWLWKTDRWPQGRVWGWSRCPPLWGWSYPQGGVIQQPLTGNLKGKSGQNSSEEGHHIRWLLCLTASVWWQTGWNTVTSSHADLRDLQLLTRWWWGTWRVGKWTKTQTKQWAARGNPAYKTLAVHRIKESGLPSCKTGSTYSPPIWGQATYCSSCIPRL